MALLKCSICGLQKEEGIGSNLCPICGGEFLPEEEKKNELLQEVTAAVAEKSEEFFHPELVKSKLYQIAHPAFEDEDKIESIMDGMKLQLEKITKRYPKKVFSYLWEGFSRNVGYVIKDRDQWRSARAMAALSAATELADAISGRSIKESPGMGFSIITNSAVDAATYIGVAAANAKMDKARQELEAVKRANQKLCNIPTGGTGASDKLVKEINLLVFNLTALHNAYTFVGSHNEFYRDASVYDAGLSYEGLNLYSLLAHAATSRSGFIGNCETINTEIDERDLAWILPELEGAGYIKYLDAYYPDKIYVTTGKYESAVLRKKYWESHPEEKQAEDKRIHEQNAALYARAEESLRNKKYYEAATAFAKIDGYKDAMARSLEIWKTRILPNLHNTISIGHHALTADGRVLVSDLDDSNKKRFTWKALKDIKQIIDLGRGQFIALGYNGRLKTYIDNDHSLYEPIAKLEKGEKKIATLANYYHDSVVFLFEDGTVRSVGHFSTGSGRDEQKFDIDLSSWNNIKKIEVNKGMVVGLRRDGTILAKGIAEKYAQQYSSWRNIVDFKIGKYGNYIIAQTSDGHYLAATNEPELCSAVSSWKNVVEVIPSYTPIGITCNGFLLRGSLEKKPDVKMARIMGQRGIVAIESSLSVTIALRADGTIYSSDRAKDYSDWKNVIYLKSHLGHDYAICANGTVLVKEENAKYASAAREAERWKIFDHIDTIQEERQRAQENSYDDYADKKSSERKRHLKSAVFYFLLSAVDVSAGFFLAFHGDGESLPLMLLAGIGCIVFGVSEIKKMNDE